MAEQSLKKRTLNGLLWNGIQRFGALAISFLANLVLVRLLDANVFGAIGILWYWCYIVQHPLSPNTLTSLFFVKYCESKAFC